MEGRGAFPREVRQTRRAILVSSVVLLAVASACQASSNHPTADSAFHQANLAEGETASLAAILVDVPGYRYVDATHQEVQNALDKVDRTALAGLSLHTVVDQQDTEVAFLQLYEFAPGILPEAPDAEVVPALMGKSPTSQTLVAGHPMFLFEDPAHPQSRYSYVWLWNGTMAAADAEDVQRLLSWMRAYLSSLGASSEPTGSGF